MTNGIKLNKTRQALLDQLADVSAKHRQEWVGADGIDPRPLNFLVANHLLASQTNGDGKRHVRLTARGWGQTPVPNPFTPEPLERTETFEHPGNPKPILGPYPKPGSNGDVPLRSRVQPFPEPTGPIMSEEDAAQRVDALIADAEARAAAEMIAPDPPEPEKAVDTSPEFVTVAALSNCADCVCREVLDWLAVRNPKVLALVDHLEAARRLREELNI